MYVAIWEERECDHVWWALTVLCLFTGRTSQGTAGGDFTRAGGFPAHVASASRRGRCECRLCCGGRRESCILQLMLCMRLWRRLWLYLGPDSALRAPRPSYFGRSHFHGWTQGHLFSFSHRDLYWGGGGISHQLYWSGLNSQAGSSAVLFRVVCVFEVLCVIWKEFCLLLRELQESMITWQNGLEAMDLLDVPKMSSERPVLKNLTVSYVRITVSIGPG